VRPENLDDAMKRTRGYWYDDGLTDLAVGVVLLLIGLLFYAQALLPPDFAGGNLTSIGLPVVVIVGWFIGGKLVRVAKERITYPRTGYVEYQQPPRKLRPLAAVVGAAIAALLSLLISARPASLALVPALQGIAAGAMLLYLGYRAGVVRYYALGALSAVFGVAIALGGFDEILGNAVYFAAIGASLVVSGALTLAAYLRQTTPPAGG
jgi:hypothetical protein